MKLKKGIAVFFMACALLIFSFPVCAASEPTDDSSSVSETVSNFDGVDFFGMIYRRARDYDDTASWYKRTLLNETITSSVPIPSQMFMQSGFFFTSDLGSFNVGYSYEIEVSVNCYNSGASDSSVGRLNSCFFASTSVSPSSWSTFTAQQLSDMSGSAIPSNMKYSFDRDTGSITALYRPSENHDSLCLRLIQWNSSASNAQLYVQLNSIKMVRDLDGSYYEQRSAELLEDINGKLDGIGESIYSGNQKLDDIQDSIDKAPQSEYDFIENKKGETKDDEEEAQGLLDNLLPLEDAKQAFTGLYDALSSEVEAPYIEFPAAYMPAFAGGVQLWEAQLIDFSFWLYDSKISLIITFGKVLFSILIIVGLIIYIHDTYAMAVGQPKAEKAGEKNG